jgi:hypothetical protein
MKHPLNMIVFVLLWLLLPSNGHAEKVVLPLTLDHKLLTSLLLQKSFTGENNSAPIVGSPGDCNYIRIEEPQFSSVDELLRLEVRLLIRAGTPLGEKCIIPVEWQGYLELMQQPVFDSRTFTFSFQTVDSNLFTLSREPANVAGVLWSFAQPRVYEYLDRVQLDLAPPVTELRSFLAPLFRDEAQQEAKAMLDSLVGGRAEVREDGVVVELLADVEEVFEPDYEGAGTELTPAENQQLVELWETWDAFLVQLLIIMAGETLGPEDQQVLMEVLLDTRHVFATALEQNTLGKDFVRVQFVRAWRQLAPVFRKQLYSKPSSNSLGYLAFFTAADALAVFDRMGPTLGIEISRHGLLRLAGMLGGETTALPYSTEVDEGVRQLLQLPPIEEEVSPLDNLEEIDLPEDESAREPLSHLFDFFARPAHGAERPTFAEILQWKVPGKDIAGYVKKVRQVLADASRKVLARKEIPDQFHGMYRKVIPAMAWQESCFRQFVVKNSKLTYLLSYNNSSVGLMQINERVWRGVYDRSRLRWDIRYNALAGCEIVDLYLRKYALRKKVWGKGASTNLLARAIYAMYNGGPGQYKKFLAREQANDHYQSDLLFLEKLQWAAKGEWNRVRQCLIGG